MGPRRRTWQRSLDRDIMCSSLNGSETHVYPEMKAFGFLFLFSWMSLAGTRAFGESEPQKQNNEKSGFYCQDRDTNAATRESSISFKEFSYHINPDKTLRFAVTVYYSYPSEPSFAVFAAHAKSIGPDKWRYETGMDSANPDDRCAVTASLTDVKSWLIEKDPATSCFKYQGARARFSYIRFDKETRIAEVTEKDVAAQLWNFDTWNHVLNCTHKGATPKPIAGRTP
jgi:hypothetical protein